MTKIAAGITSCVLHNLQLECHASKRPEVWIMLQSLVVTPRNSTSRCILSAAPPQCYLDLCGVSRCLAASHVRNTCTIRKAQVRDQHVLLRSKTLPQTHRFCGTSGFSYLDDLDFASDVETNTRCTTSTLRQSNLIRMFRSYCLDAPHRLSHILKTHKCRAGTCHHLRARMSVVIAQPF